MGTSDSEMRMIRMKLRHDEHVRATQEAYQIVGNDQHNLLLALVNANGSNAIFCFALSTWPIAALSDFTIQSVYPINDKFDLVINRMRHHFRLSSEKGQGLFYYSAQSTSEKVYDIDFFGIVEQAQLEFGFNAQHIQFDWLETYIPKDLLAIDRHIADGSTTIQKRDAKFREELEKREHEYTVHQPYRIYTATWNVNGQTPGDTSLQKWFSACEEPPDIYAVAFQELDMSPKAITFSESRPDPVWIKAVMDGVHPDDAYEELVSVRLVGMMLIVIIKSSLRKNVIRYTSQSVGTGALNIMGNKGGVGVSLQLNESYICFVNSHLAAHIHEVERRNEDHDEIIRRMQFEYGIIRRCIDEHDNIFWIGDLNYRIIDTRIDQSTDLFDCTDYSPLIRYDQLYLEMEKRRVFQKYHEGKITFRPTYKYDMGTDNWDSSEKSRAPAWCDRVLWKGEKIQQLSYNSVMAIRLSDHKPIYSLFIAHMKTRDEIQYKRVHEEVLKTVDKYENDNQPQITVAETDIDFGVIRFNEPVAREFTIANNCHLPVEFEFSGKEGKGTRVCENWLQITPVNGKLITGSSTTIRLELFIDARTAALFNHKQKESNVKVPLEILVLHVENGRDIFITIIGEYKPSCFGFSIETLCSLTEPLANLNLKELMTLENRLMTSTPGAAAVNLKSNVPREIWFLIDNLYKTGLDIVNLFTVDRKYARNVNVNEIRDWLDNWSTDEFPGAPHTTAEALLMLLESSPQPLIHPLEEECLYAERFEGCCDLIKILSVQKQCTFTYLCMFLQELIKHTASNRMDAQRIARIFGKVLIERESTGHARKPSTKFTNSSNVNRIMSEREKADRRTVFMLRFLSNELSDLAKSHLKFTN